MQQHYLIPGQGHGRANDLETHIHADTIEEAEDWFVESKDRLLDINNWAKFSPVFGSLFSLKDTHGKVLGRYVRKGDPIFINTEAINDNGCLIADAVEYDDFPDDNKESFAIRLVSMVPGGVDGGEVQAAMQNIGISVTLVIERSGRQLSAFYHGRNDNGWLGVADEQWADLLKGFIE